MGNLNKSQEPSASESTMPTVYTEISHQNSSHISKSESKEIPSFSIQSNYLKMRSVGSLKQNPSECVSSLISTYDILIHTSKLLPLFSEAILFDSLNPRWCEICLKYVSIYKSQAAQALKEEPLINIEIQIINKVVIEKANACGLYKFTIGKRRISKKERRSVSPKRGKFVSLDKGKLHVRSTSNTNLDEFTQNNRYVIVYTENKEVLHKLENVFGILLGISNIVSKIN
ncbi:unnamed protein product [Blepharisma stoltei]|uniref:Uncharacterized protein n=1 Tax=Blepharisma stoltei TaxID=1481888 RepID=A0AAU9IWR8_9CILI|nr:unnamed protein product [Blepharisma stoltei]